MNRTFKIWMFSIPMSLCVLGAELQRLVVYVGIGISTSHSSLHRSSICDRSLPRCPSNPNSLTVLPQPLSTESNCERGALATTLSFWLQPPVKEICVCWYRWSGGPPPQLQIRNHPNTAPSAEIVALYLKDVNSVW